MVFKFLLNLCYIGLNLLRIADDLSKRCTIGVRREQLISPFILLFHPHFNLFFFYSVLCHDNGCFVLMLFSIWLSISNTAFNFVFYFIISSQPFASLTMLEFHIYYVMYINIKYFYFNRIILLYLYSIDYLYYMHILYLITHIMNSFYETEITRTFWQYNSAYAKFYIQYDMSFVSNY